jgi:hypothetical protein
MGCGWTSRGVPTTRTHLPSGCVWDCRDSLWSSSPPPSNRTLPFRRSGGVCMEQRRAGLPRLGQCAPPSLTERVVPPVVAWLTPFGAVAWGG